MKRMIFFTVIFWTISFCPVTWAYKAYITDSFRISLREEDNLESKILKFLLSGQPVEVVEEKEGWSNIRMTENDNTQISGWILSRYLITSIPCEEQAGQLREENIRLTNEILSLEGKLTDAASLEYSLSDELRKREDSLDSLRTKYERLEKDASGYLNLKKQYEKTKKIMDQLSSENEAMRSYNSQRWFVMGALVLLCGLLIGIMMGRREKKLKSYY